MLSVLPGRVYIYIGVPTHTVLLMVGVQSYLEESKLRGQNRNSLSSMSSLTLISAGFFVPFFCATTVSENQELPLGCRS